MIGGLVIFVFLVIVVPPAVVMTFAGVAVGLGSLLKSEVDAEHEGGELLELNR